MVPHGVGHENHDEPVLGGVLYPHQHGLDFVEDLDAFLRGGHHVGGQNLVHFPDSEVLHGRDACGAAALTLCAHERANLETRGHVFPFVSARLHEGYSE